MSLSNISRPASRVCIVDDEPGIRDLLQILCESAELPVATYGSAEAFLAEMGAGLSSCELLLLDIDMPGMSGLELLKGLKEQGFERPVVMISGNADTSKVDQAMQLGAAGFFSKPFDVRTVGQRIRELAAGGGWALSEVEPVRP